MDMYIFYFGNDDAFPADIFTGKVIHKILTNDYEFILWAQRILKE